MPTRSGPRRRWMAVFLAGSAALLTSVAFVRCTTDGSESGASVLREETSEVAAAVPDGTDPPEPEMVASAFELQFAATGPSQSVEDAERDGILPELASTSAADRIGSVDELLATAWTQQIETPEGIYRISRPPLDLRPTASDCRLGDVAGVPYRDWICIGTDYVEVLLVDPASAEIRRAYPFSGTSMSGLQLTEDAVYCFREPDGGYPDLMICRIDRASGELRVRVWKSPEPDANAAVPLDRWAPDTWTLDVEPGDWPGVISPGRPTVVIEGQQTDWTIDAESLEVYDVACADCSE